MGMARRFFLAMLLLCASTVQGAERHVVAGAGPSTRIVTAFFERFATTRSAQGHRFIVPPRSIKHAGGIRSAEKNLFGRTGRPLTAAERDNGDKREIFLGKIPLTFARGNGVGASRISLAQLREILTGRLTNWFELGGEPGAILLVGREPTEAALTALRKVLPEIDRAPFARTFRRDHQVVNFLRSPQGRLALGFGVKPNFPEKNRLIITGLTMGLTVGLVYDNDNRDNPLIDAARRFARSDAWRREVRRLDMIPLE